MSEGVTLYSSGSCHKGQRYANFLRERGIAFTFRDVEADDEAARELRALYEDGELKFPTLLIAGKRVRNPSDRELLRALARAGIYDPGVVHEPRANRFVKFMSPADAFVSYSQNDERMVLTHIEVPVERRGGGIGARIALEVFEQVRALGVSARITCTFMRRVAASDPQWAEFFNIAPASAARIL